jgi:hypothetical protein
MITLLFVLIWWIAVAAIGFAVFAFMRFISNPSLNNDEVGYVHDAFGNLKPINEDKESQASPSADIEAQERAVGHQAGSI